MNLEYTKMAYLYDKFYQNKKYDHEVEFIKHFISYDNITILDAGCGTGTHAKLLHEESFLVYGFDLSEEMVAIANEKIPNHFFVGNVLNFETKEKFELIISFYAVFNHLKSYKEFEIALKNLKKNLKENGKIIIDLHNPQHSGTKTDKIDNATRIMKWRKCAFLGKEFSTLTYTVDSKNFVTHHTFKIFKPKKLEKIAKNLGFSQFKAYENYDINKTATTKSKNVQIVLSIG